MNYSLKAILLFAVLGLALHLKPAFAETSSGPSSSAPKQNPKTSDKSADQPDAKTSEEPTRSNSAKDSAAAHPLESSAAGEEDSDSAGSAAALQGPALFKLIDTDKDGRISLAEFIAYGTAARTTGSGKISPGGNTRSKSPSGSSPRNAGAKNVAAETVHTDKQPTAPPESDSPGAVVLTSTDTRAGKYTAEVFEILDINHDKFLSQAELDALIPAHQISQP